MSHKLVFFLPRLCLWALATVPAFVRGRYLPRLGRRKKGALPLGCLTRRLPIHAVQAWAKR
jgi:hypothetical protein